MLTPTDTAFEIHKSCTSKRNEISKIRDILATRGGQDPKNETLGDQEKQKNDPHHMKQSVIL